MHFFVYLDEFGHIGHFVSRFDPRFKTSPVFGLGGLALPVEEIRKFSMFFFKLKEELLSFEIERSTVHKAKWEKKGSDLYRKKNIVKYRELRKATNRLINTVKSSGGFIFHDGIEKDSPSTSHNPEGLYLSVLKQSLKKLNIFFRNNNSTFSVFLDAIDSNDPGAKRKFRLNSIEASSISMFGAERCTSLLEPPYQLESHLYQNLQCADWFCGLFGRRYAYKTRPHEYPEYECVEKYFGVRLETILKAHSLKRRQIARIISRPS